MCLSILGYINPLGRSGASNFDKPEFIDPDLEDDFEKDLIVRKDFRETWIHDDIIIGYLLPVSSLFV